MRLLINPRFWLVMMLLIFGVVACDLQEAPEQDTADIAPSITLKPPFLSQTPAFTATPTFTPTPEVTETLTPSPTVTYTTTELPTMTLTPTAALHGSVLSAQNVNIREEADTDSGVIVTIQPNREIDIIGAEENDLGQIWYYIGFIGDDDFYHRGYITSRLVDDGGQAIPTLAATFTPLPPGFDPEETIIPFESATPAEGEPTSVAAEATPSRDLSDRNILAYCVKDGVRPVSPTTDETVSIYWRWWVVASRPELMDDHLDNAYYEVYLDGQLLSNWADYQTEMIQDSSNSNRWTVFWYVPVGKLDAGEHTVDFKVTWRAEITDGIDPFGPGTNTPEDTGNCTFTVVADN